MELSNTMHTYDGIPMIKGHFGGNHGWICPKCGRVLSPWTQYCPFCIPIEDDSLNIKLPEKSNLGNPIYPEDPYKRNLDNFVYSSNSIGK